MTITNLKEEAILTIALEGRLDTATAPQLEASLKESLVDVQELVIDLANLDYISSAGLRVILGAQKQMSKLGGMTVKNVNDVIMEVFEITGFSDILTSQ